MILLKDHPIQCSHSVSCDTFFFQYHLKMCRCSRRALAQLSEPLGSRPGLMCCGSWKRASQCLNFLPQNTPILLGADQPFSRPAAGQGKPDLFPSLHLISGDPPIPLSQFSFLRIYPHSLHSQGHCEFSSDLHHFPPEILQ